MFAGLQGFIIFAVSVAVMIGAVWGLIDAARHNERTYANAGKSKTKWLLLLGGAVLFAFVSLPPPIGRGGGVLQIFGIAAIIVVILYFVDIRKKLQGNRPPSGGSGFARRGGW